MNTLWFYCIFSILPLDPVTGLAFEEEKKRFFSLNRFLVDALPVATGQVPLRADGLVGVQEGQHSTGL